MQVYNFRPMDVKDYFKPALTSEDFDRLDAAHAYYADAGKGYHTFAQTCSEPTCNGYWCITISETDPMFRGAIDRAVSGGLCRACQDAAKLAMPSLITYRAKSASGGNGGNGGSKGGKVTRRKQAGRRSNPRTSYAQQIAASHGWTLVKVGNRYYMTKEGEQARSFSNLDQVLDFVQQQAKAVA